MLYVYKFTSKVSCAMSSKARQAACNASTELALNHAAVSRPEWSSISSAGLIEPSLDPPSPLTLQQNCRNSAQVVRIATRNRANGGIVNDRRAIGTRTLKTACLHAAALPYVRRHTYLVDLIFHVMCAFREVGA